MAKINYDYSEEKVLYDSGDIEERLLSKYKNRIKPSEFEDDYFYTLTSIRENIINWYPFKKGSNILEVGGGLGSITGTLCNSAAKVVSCEYSKRRAENIYYRHKDRDNLEVIVGNLNKVKFKEKFDYIVLIGVFEYAKRFCPDSENPFLDFLNNLKKNLKDDGIILIAIENRYGIKYWAGALEDHYPEKYIGLTGYGENYDIQTLGKQELINIFEKVDLNNYKFYYPYPDYKMPYIITTDKRELYYTEIPSLKLYNHGNQIYNFDYRKVLPGIIKNKKYDFFANSFLIELSATNKNLSNIIYVKSHWVRSERCQINTIIKEDKKISKIPKTLAAIKHLDDLIKNQENIKKLGIPISEVIKKGNEYEVEFVEGEVLTEYINNLTQNKDKKLILIEIDNFNKILKSISYNGKIQNSVIVEQKKYYGEEKVKLLKIGLYDLHFSNIIKNKEKYTVIDQEWIIDKDIPLNYMLYFAINYLFEWIEEFKNLFTLKDLLQRYNITDEEVELFQKMSPVIAVEQLNVCERTIYITETQNKIDLIDKIIEENKNQLKQKETELENNKQEIENNKQIINNYETELNNILNSKRWKYTDKVLNIKNKLFKRK